MIAPQGILSKSTLMQRVYLVKARQVAQLKPRGSFVGFDLLKILNKSVQNVTNDISI